MWGYHEDGRLVVGLPRRRQPGAGRGHPGRAGAPSPSGPLAQRPPLLDDRRPARTRSAGLWTRLAPHWGRRRESCAGTSRTWRSPAEPPVAPDPLVRRTRPADLDVLYPACVAMYTEEVGVSPELGGGADLYRARVAQLVGQGLVVRPDRGRPGGVQGRGGRRLAVRLPGPGRLRRPARRGEGLAAPGWPPSWSWRCATSRRSVSLYVNEHNSPPGGPTSAVGFRADRHLRHDHVLTVAAVGAAWLAPSTSVAPRPRGRSPALRQRSRRCRPVDQLIIDRRPGRHLRRRRRGR